MRRSLRVYLGCGLSVLLLVMAILAGCSSTPAPTKAPTAAPAPAPAPPQVIKVKFSTYLVPAPYAQSIATDWWASEIKKRTNGLVDISLTYGGALTKSGEELEQIKSGLIDTSWLLSMSFSSMVPLSNFGWALPFAPGDPTIVAKAATKVYQSVPALTDEVMKYN